MIDVSKITEKGRTTVPQKIRDAFQISAGDLIAWEVDEDGNIRVRRVDPIDITYLRGLEETLSEWSSKADEEAYRDLRNGKGWYLQSSAEISRNMD